MATHQTDWPTHLPFVVNAYNTTEHSATGFSPFFLMYGREQNTPIDVVLGDTRPSGQQVGNYAQLLVDRMRQAHALARENLKRTAERVKKYYDVGVRHKQFNEGDRVWMLNPRRFKKRSPKWERPYVGPFTVVKKINDVNYLITRGAGSSAIVTHVDKLKRYANVMCLFRREKMPFSCPRCAYQTDVYANIRRHAFSQHRAYWRGPERTLEPVPPHELSEVAERHRLRQRNSRQRRRDRDREEGVQPTRRIASVSTSRARVDMDSSSSQDEGGSRRSVAATRVVGRPAGLSDFEVSDLEFPELSDGALRDLDIDPADWELGDYLGAVAPAPETQVAQVSTGVQVDPAFLPPPMQLWRRTRCRLVTTTKHRRSRRSAPVRPAEYQRTCWRIW